MSSLREAVILKIVEKIVTYICYNIPRYYIARLTLNRRSLKMFPTVIPIAAPKIVPATQSENQWIVTETPTPM